jgi:DNA polymerase III epsilon subunit-like protein
MSAFSGMTGVTGGFANIVFDLETTGCPGSNLFAERHVIIQLAAGCEGHKFNETVNPGGVPIPSGSTACHGLSVADLSSSPQWASVAQKFILWCNQVANGRSITLVAHNAEMFDVPVLLKELDRVGMSEYVATWFSIDTLLVARRAWPHLKAKCGYGGFTLGELYKDCTGSALEGAHDAWNDVGGLTIVFDRMTTEGIILESDVRAVGVHVDQPDDQSLLSVRFLGVATARKIKHWMRKKGIVWKGGGDLTIGDLRAAFAGRTMVHIEYSLRTAIGLHKDEQLLHIISAVANVSCREMSWQFPFLPFAFEPLEKFFTPRARRKLCQDNTRTISSLFQVFLYQFDSKLDAFVGWVVKRYSVRNRAAFKRAWCELYYI